ncbi:EamA family transporter [Litchfieldia alkalitelluris]|uniref:EamA family transporter n=1 Tax=Litchfieldia alkalitelluris TaxID=304268 RepID=UPI000998CBAA|nr:DMT family transporter [Litchfieldia alkalitelluris]
METGKNQFVHTRGLVMVMVGAMLWGLSGTAAQYLFQTVNITAEWLVTVRMLISGMLLLLFAGFKGKGIWSVWKSRKVAFQFLLFGILGMLGVQYTYFASIATGNAATATILQYLAPVFIVLFFIIKIRKLPTTTIFLSIVLALLGTVLLITNGSFSGLTVPLISAVWGILSGVALAFYTIYSATLLKVWDSLIVTGWGMVIGGLTISFFTTPWETGYVEWSITAVLLILFVIFFGTLVAFYLYIGSLKYVTAEEASILSSVEPLAACLAAIIFLNLSLGMVQMIGGLFVIITVSILSIKKKKVIIDTNAG